MEYLMNIKMMNMMRGNKSIHPSIHPILLIQFRVVVVELGSMG